MKTKILNKVALRYRALYLPIERKNIQFNEPSSAVVMAFLARLQENGYTVSEELLHALCLVSADDLALVTAVINEVMQVDLNWAPLVKGWQVPTNESLADHLITFFANVFGDKKATKGTILPCGHLIPEGTFPIERYNGCPFCGAQFHTADFVYKGQNSKLRELRLFTKEDMEQLFNTLLTCTTPLNATEKDSLELLLNVFAVPQDMNIPMKETSMLVVQCLVKQDKAEEASRLLPTPADVMRYLWFEKTGYLQIIEPKTLIKNARRLYSHLWKPLDRSEDAAAKTKEMLKLHYNRKDCLRTAKWLNQTTLTAQQAAENMHAKRGMWVRFIRALRLSEYARKDGLEHLAEILDVFYKQEYDTWQGKADRYRKNADKVALLNLLKQRPGLFARCLFATMLRFGAEEVLAAFEEIADKLSTRLLISLGNAAESYFDTDRTRIVRPITGQTKAIEPNRLLLLYNEDERREMQNSIQDIYKRSMYRRFEAMPTNSKTIFIDPALFQVPVSVGDRSATIQDSSCALMGTRFAVEGTCVRLFMQWGKGLPAQHLDMDLSCRIAYADGKTDYCYFGYLECTGTKHSGDIREIPEKVGTAEYIELNLPELTEAGASYVTFTCNAYSTGAISPNLTVGWMNAENPMKISSKTGVAYDPSCVQHAVRISENNLSKGLVFGVLDIAKREIVWLEMPFSSQTIHHADQKTIGALLQKLSEKLTVGELLQMKAQAQKLTPTQKAEEADEVYTYEWALNPAAVSSVVYL